MTDTVSRRRADYDGEWMGKVAIALWAAAALPPATLRIEYRQAAAVAAEGGTQLEIAWSTRAASGELVRKLSAADVAALDDFARAAATPGSDWRTASVRAAELLLDGIGPLDQVRRLVISTQRAPLLKKVPFEALGNLPLIERFAVWSETPQGGADGLALRWDPPEGAEAGFTADYRRQLRAGLDPAAAVRQVKVAWLHGGGDRAHPAQWAAIEWQGPAATQAGRAGAQAVSLGWLPWVAGVSLLASGAGLGWWWWRRERLELW